MKLIGITGRAGAGKSTVAQMLKTELGAVEISLADPIKEFVHCVFAVPKPNLWGASELREQPFTIDVGGSRERFWFLGGAFLREWAPNAYGKPTGPFMAWFEAQCATPLTSARKLCQQLGTEFGRTHLSPNCWIDLAMLRADRLKHSGANCIVIPDVRFDNEARAILQSGGEVLEVLRLGRRKSDHASESGLSPEVHRIKIINDRGIEELKTEVLDTLHSLGWIGD